MLILLVEALLRKLESLDDVDDGLHCVGALVHGAKLEISTAIWKDIIEREEPVCSPVFGVGTP